MMYDDHMYCERGHCGDCWCFEIWLSGSGEPCGVDHDEGE